MIDKIRDCKNMKQLDDLRIEIIQQSKVNPINFKNIQKEFIKKKNQIKNMPLLREKIVWKGESE